MNNAMLQYLLITFACLAGLLAYVGIGAFLGRKRLYLYKVYIFAEGKDCFRHPLAWFLWPMTAWQNSPQNLIHDAVAQVKYTEEESYTDRGKLKKTPEDYVMQSMAFWPWFIIHPFATYLVWIPLFYLVCVPLDWVVLKPIDWIYKMATKA